MQIGMPQANALKSIGYTDTVLFLTIGKPDIYQHKILGKSATVFYPGDQELPKFAAKLPNLFCDKYPATVHLPHYQWSGKVVYPYILQILDAFASGISICTRNR
jgi:hypothetical protein